MPLPKHYNPQEADAGALEVFLKQALPDLASACRASQVLVVDDLAAGLMHISVSGGLELGIKP